jgi:ubiquinone/menaquinone biosynthesis C-methylase UbiE
MDKKQEYFDTLGDDWDRDLTAEDLERLSHIIDKVDIPAGVSVCDLGCGTGVLFDLLRRRVGETGYIVGVDFAPRVAHKAQRNFPFHNIGVVEADACCIPFQDKTFDLVISFAAFAHFHHKDETIHQAHHILKPGGKIIIIHLYGRTELARQHHQVGGPIDRDELPDRPELEDMFNRGHFSRFELTDTKDLYLAVGFKE